LSGLTDSSTRSFPGGPPDRAGRKIHPFRHDHEFGQRIVDAAGKSLNIELYPRLEKLGGNGPIMAHALLTQARPSPTSARWART